VTILIEYLYWLMSSVYCNNDLCRYDAATFNRFLLIITENWR
jgi:hypothetical protein